MLLRMGLWFVVFIHKPQRANNTLQVKERPKMHAFSESLTRSILVITSSNSCSHGQERQMRPGSHSCFPTNPELKTLVIKV